jgi:hypothetical protein
MARRSALIVANDRYADPGLRRLRAPTQDAEALARVLGQPGVGDFEVEVVTNEPEHRLRREIAAFFADRDRDDLLLAHLSCHGVKDDSGELYFATADTELTSLDATAVPADFVNRHMGWSRSRRVVLLLDCCYSGAFAGGMVHRAGTGLDLRDRFEGRGRVVLTASSAMEYAFEDTELSFGRGSPSVFSRAVVQGPETGEADWDGDGLVSVDELYDYVYDQVRRSTPKQTPGRWTFDLQGDAHIARNPRPRAVERPAELRQALKHPVAGVRLGAVGELERLRHGQHLGLALAAGHALQEMQDDDSHRISAAAAAALGAPAPELAQDAGPPPEHAPAHAVRPAPADPAPSASGAAASTRATAGGLAGGPGTRAASATEPRQAAATGPAATDDPDPSAVRASGRFQLTSLSAGCRASVVDDSGQVGSPGFEHPAGTGGDTAPLHSDGGFHLVVSGDRGCRTTLHSSGDGTQLEQRTGDEDSEVLLTGNFFVRTDARCTTRVEDA